jgi:hypothetical protein
VLDKLLVGGNVPVRLLLARFLLATGGRLSSTAQGGSEAPALTDTTVVLNSIEISESLH